MLEYYEMLVESLNPENELEHAGVKGMKWKNHIYKTYETGKKNVKKIVKRLKKALKKFGKNVKKHTKGFYKYTVDRTTDNIGKGVKKVKKGAKAVKNRLDGTHLYNTMNKEWNKIARESAKSLNKKASKYSGTLQWQKEHNKKHKSVKNPGNTALAIVETGANATAATKRLMDTRQGEIFEKPYYTNKNNKDFRNLMANAYTQGWNTANYQNRRRKSKRATEKAQSYKKRR